MKMADDCVDEPQEGLEKHSDDALNKIVPSLANSSLRAVSVYDGKICIYYYVMQTICHTFIENVFDAYICLCFLTLTL